VGDPLVGVVVRVAAVSQTMPGDVHDLFGAERAGEDPDQGDPPHMSVDGGLDHLGDQWPGRIAGQRGVGGAVHPGHRREVMLQR